MTTPYASRQTKVLALCAARMVPVLRYDTTATAAYAAEVAIGAGCTTLELTWTIPGVIDVLLALREKHGHTVLLGVGTLCTEAQARTALEAGADFLVSPALTPGLTDMAHAMDVPCLLGAFTPSEVMAADREGADIVKIFPADSGGPKHLAALKSVFPDIVFCPTGGVTSTNMHDYFRAGAALVGMGANLFDKVAFAERDSAALVRQVAHTLEQTRA